MLSEKQKAHLKDLHSLPWTKERREKFHNSMKGHPASEKARIKLIERNKKNNPMKDIASRIKSSKSHMGKVAWNKGRQWIERMGENHPNWKGGVSLERHQVRKSIEYKLWRKSVFERDNYTCVWCGQLGGKLNADHVKPFVLYPELRFAIDNGRTLCVPCHRKTDTYGFRKLYSKK